MSSKGDPGLRAMLNGASVGEYLEKEKRLDDEHFKDQSWYHGKGTNRRKAESLLLADNKEGTFLVRESYSCPRDLVLSVCEGDKKVGHYKIERNETDFTYYKLESSKDQYVHGLETFIMLRRNLGFGLPCKLTNFVKGQRVPAACMQRGRTNFLHHASASSDGTDYVKKILKDKNCPNIDSKNDRGSTALHIASANGNCAVINLLLKKGASVDIKDLESCTPLQVACKDDTNSAAVVVLCSGGASLVARTFEGGRSPMHIAAMQGNLNCVKELLAVGAPHMPHDRSYQTPHDLAKAAGHSAVAQLLNDYVCPPAQVSKEDWFHPQLDRQGAEKLLTAHAKRDGLFLVRKSSKNPNNYAISLCYEQLIFHYEIKTLDNKIFFINDSPYMISIEHLIEHFSKYSDGLCCSLRFALTLDRKEKVITTKKASRKLGSGPQVASAISAPIQQALPSRSVAPAKSSHVAAALPSLPSSNSSEVNVVPPAAVKQSVGDNPQAAHKEKSLNEIPVFAAPDVILESELGQGEFGSVMKGYIIGRKSTGNELATRTAVAVKTLHDEHIQQADFLREAVVMFALRHENIVRLIGICKGPPVMIIQELVAFGSMLDYLLDYSDKVNMETDLYLWAAQIAFGMMYLEQRGFVHRDLAARNILLQSKTVAKISDFGLSRAVNANSDYYKASKGGRWPVKWYAPESINYGTFSHASDVWSYGVTLFEMFSYGEQPYGDMTGSEVLSFIERNGRLASPKGCPKQVYEMMMRCWLLKPAERPTFLQLHDHFDTHPAYASIRSMLQQPPMCE